MTGGADRFLDTAAWLSPDTSLLRQRPKKGEHMEYHEFRFAFHARDFVASVHFYHNTLGMKYVGGWDRPDGKGALLAAGAGTVVEIFGVPEGEHYEGPAPVAMNLALRLDEPAALDAFYEELHRGGVKLEGPPRDRPWGHRSFVAFDPDGIPVHFYCEVANT